MKSSRQVSYDVGVYAGILFFVVSLTKSAQWPFISWLPAAIAAPTPVSALVHRSTLVTAGVWLIIRFGQTLAMFSHICFVLGLTTLSVAGLAAMLETDSKKVVALSTLSQLGLMVFSLSLGNVILCFFHVVTHALSKANLFLVVGGLLYSHFSQQDSRFISSGGISFISALSGTIRIVGLSGFVFSSGFYSKELVLYRHYFCFSRTRV